MTAPRLEWRCGAFVLVLEGAEYGIAVQDGVMLVECSRPAPLHQDGHDEPAGSAYPKEGIVVFLLWDSWRQIAFEMDHLKRLMLCQDGASVQPVAGGAA